MAFQQHFHQFFPCIGQVSALITILFAVHHQFTEAVDSSCVPCDKACSPTIRQFSAMAGIPSQRDFGVDLVYILPTWTTAARSIYHQLFVWNRQPSIYE